MLFRSVVHAAVIAQDTINRFLEQLNTDRDLHQSYGQLNPEFSHQVITEILEPFGGELTVTPKEIDTLINSTAKILASGLSLALHPDLTPEDYTFYLH